MKTRHTLCYASVFFFLLSILSCKNKETKRSEASRAEAEVKTNYDTTAPFAIVIHGGAGTILKENMTSEKEKAYTDKLAEAIRAGHSILEKGGTSMDAVIATIQIMEDSPLFNAGKGAVFTHEETNEMDASIMDGKTLNAGAIAGVTVVKSPIALARKVMEDSPHVMLAGKGAEQFAREQKLEIVDPSYFFTPERKASLDKVKAKALEKQTALIDDPIYNDYKFGTVGCVALDKDGNLAAGTSTGGMTNKRWNRIGDAPIIGAGTYANNATCAVSCTGWGEYFIRAMAAYDVSALVGYTNMSLSDATQEVIQTKIPALGGDGGLIAIDKSGNISMEFNTAGMYRAAIDKEGKLQIGIYKEREKISN